MKIRWRLKGGFSDTTDYLEWDGKQMWLVLRDGSREETKIYDVQKCREFVKSGCWDEWSAVLPRPGEEG